MLRIWCVPFHIRSLLQHRLNLRFFIWITFPIFPICLVGFNWIVYIIPQIFNLSIGFLKFFLIFPIGLVGLLGFDYTRSLKVQYSSRFSDFNYQTINLKIFLIISDFFKINIQNRLYKKQNTAFPTKLPCKQQKHP